MSRDRLDNQYESPGRWADRAACATVPQGVFLVDVASLRRAHRKPPVPPYAREAQRHADRAKRICIACPVLAECREWALTDPDPAYGMVAGGLDPVERAEIRRRARRQGST